MGHRLAVATAFAAAALFTSAAYAGSPYYDASGQMSAQPMTAPHARMPASTGRHVSPRAAAQYKTSTATPGMASDGYAKPAPDAEAFGHAEGADGSSVASGEAAAPEAAPVYSAAMPKMDADGFEHRQGDSAFFRHAVGTDGSAAEVDAAPATPKADPVYTAAMPKMDPDGFQHRESDSSFYEHAVGTMGTP